MPSKAVRRGIYFSEEDNDLLKYIDSQPVSASKFVTQVIREKMEGRLNPVPLATDDITNRQLLKEIQNLLRSHPAQPRPKEAAEPISYSGSYGNLLSGMDDF